MKAKWSAGMKSKAFHLTLIQLKKATTFTKLQKNFWVTKILGKNFGRQTQTLNQKVNCRQERNFTTSHKVRVNLLLQATQNRLRLLLRTSHQLGQTMQLQETKLIM